MVDRFELMQKKARVHFIPNLKVGVFVTLRTLYVIIEHKYGTHIPHNAIHRVLLENGLSNENN